jgi:DNA-binding response OmpR family regulator
MVPNAKVLVVHRDKDFVDWLRAHLEADGFRVLAASDGPSALDLLSSEAPALVLMDFMPPRSSMDSASGAPMDSFQLLRRLRLKSDVGVIVLSRETDEEIKLYFLDSGADDYLIWPCHRRELLARIRAVVRRTHRALACSESPRSPA